MTNQNTPRTRMEAHAAEVREFIASDAPLTVEGINALRRERDALRAELAAMTERAEKAENAEKERDALIGLNVEFYMICPPDAIGSKQDEMCRYAKTNSGEDGKPGQCVWCWRENIKGLATLNGAREVLARKEASDA